MAALPDIARTTVAEHDMLPAGVVVLALVSGGADSVALVRLLASGDLGDVSGRLSVLHINHLLRGDDAEADELFVTALCDTLAVACRVVRYDVAAYARAEGFNLEDAGRRVRYRFADDELDARCDALGVPREAGRIAVAHTADDRLETFLARIVTGAGAGGLASIAPVRGRIVRPLIGARRAEVTAYLGELGQPWREDVTNADTEQQRAWLRHKLLPLIERRNPSFSDTVGRTMTVLSGDEALLAQLSAEAARRVVAHDGDAVVFDRAALAAVPRALARRMVRDAIRASFPEASRVTFEHVEAIAVGVADDGFARDLPFGLRAEAEYGTIRVSRRGDSSGSVAPGLLELPGALDLVTSGTIAARELPAGSVAPGPDTISIDAGAVRWPLVVDAVRAGDRMRPLGLEGSKKLSDIFIDAKVPGRVRHVTPVVRDGDRIVWLAGVALAEECRVTPATERVAELTWRRPQAGG
jgi:tRNA(Ile)-lysidine synthase